MRFNNDKFNKMSKRCKLQKEYYKEFGNYKGSGKYTDHYVSWLESRVLALTIHGVSGSYCKDDLRVAFEQARCNKHSFEDWYEFNYC